MPPRARAAATEQASEAAPDWASLPAVLWERIAAALPAEDLMALRQGWRVAVHLAEERVRAEAARRLRLRLGQAVEAARAVARGADDDDAAAALEAVQQAADASGDPRWMAPPYLAGVMMGVGETVGPYRYCLDQQLWPGRPDCRVVLASSPPGCGVDVTMAVTITELPEDALAEVQLESMRFEAPGGACITEYGLAWALDDTRASVSSIRLGGGSGFGLMQARPMGEAAAHFEALRAAAAQLPLRTPDGRWSDGLLLPSIHGAVTQLYALQL